LLYSIEHHRDDREEQERRDEKRLISCFQYYLRVEDVIKRQL